MTTVTTSQQSISYSGVRKGQVTKGLCCLYHVYVKYITGVSNFWSEESFSFF